jgi:tetratricopeptide (TPR) repeat protein
MIKNILVFTSILIFSFSQIYAQSTLERKLGLAQSYEKSRQVDNAIRLYEEIITEDKKNTEAFQGLVRSYRYKSMNNELLELMQARLEFEKSALNYIMLGEAHWKAGNPTEADITWAKAIELAKDNEFAYQNLADIQSKLQLYEKAIATYKKGREEIGQINNSTAFVNELSKLYVAIGDVKNAIDESLIMLIETGALAEVEARIFVLMQDKESQKIIDSKLAEFADDYSSNYTAMELYSWYQTNIDNYSKALEYTIKADDISESEGRLILVFGNNAERDGQTDIALEAYQYLIDEGRDNKYFSSATYNFTKALESKFLFQDKFDRSKVEEIIEKYETIIDEFDKTTTAADAYLEKARLEKNYLNDLDAADQTLKNLINNIPGARQSGDALIQLGDIYIAKGNLNLAMDYIDKAVVRYSRTELGLKERAIYKFGIIQYYKGDLDSAQVIFNNLSEAIDSDIANDALEKNSIIADKEKERSMTELYAKSEYALVQNDTSSATENFVTIIEDLSNYDTEVWQRSNLILADIYREKGESETAAKYLNNLATNLTDGVHTDKAIYRLALIRAEQGNSQRAIELLSKILVDFPDSIYLKDARKRIRELREES